MKSRTLLGALVVAACGWVLSTAILSTVALSQGASPVLRLPFRLLCHGLAERGFSLFGTAMPICARCTGIYAGLIVGVGIALYLRGRCDVPIGGLVLLITPLLLDGVTQALGWRESENMLRLITGILAGSVFAAWALTQIRDEEISVATT